LLRVLQDQTFERVGGNETVRTDVRLIAATNVDLEDAVRTGRFRHDLFFRLNVFTIHLPPLRERGSDIDILTDFYLARFAREFGRPRLAVPEATRSALRDYSWPGNVRELQSVLKQGLLRSTGTVLLRSSLNLTAIRPPAAHSPSPSPPEGPDVFDRPPPRATPGAEWEAFIAERLAAGSHNLYAECLEAMERQLLTKILTQTGGNQLRAAELLGITRSSLRHKLRNLGIPAGRSADPDEEP
jgi:two-component system nitrogen regulation response regulator GlnG